VFDAKAKAEAKPKPVIPQTPPKGVIPQTPPKAMTGAEPPPQATTQPGSPYCALSCAYRGCPRTCEGKYIKHTGACFCVDHEAGRIECAMRAYQEGTPYFCSRYCQGVTEGNSPMPCARECTMYEGNVGNCMCENHGGNFLYVKRCKGPPKIDAAQNILQHAGK
jgi:hypothetical protein